MVRYEMICQSDWQDGAIEMQVKIWCCYLYMPIEIRTTDGTLDLSLSLVSGLTLF